MNELQVQIDREYSALKTAGAKAAFVRKLKLAKMPLPTTRGAVAKHADQDAIIARLKALAAKPAEVKKAA